MDVKDRRTEDTEGSLIIVQKDYPTNSSNPNLIELIKLKDRLGRLELMVKLG